MKQLILPFECHPTFKAPDFVISSANKDAYLWLMQWPEWPSHCFAIYGDGGCGKTHLSHIWQEQSQRCTLWTGQDLGLFKLVFVPEL